MFFKTRNEATKNTGISFVSQELADQQCKEMDERGCIQCRGCTNCYKCTNCVDCTDCSDCSNCMSCFACTDCSSCYNEAGLYQEFNKSGDE
jgi:hypothetical protein